MRAVRPRAGDRVLKMRPEVSAHRQVELRRAPRPFHGMSGTRQSFTP